MSEIDRINKALLVAYINDTDCVVSNADCNELTKYIAKIERESSENKLVPAILPAQCIDNLRLRKEEIIQTLSKLMYWMDKAREGQEIDLDKFNVVWKECEEVVNHEKD